MASFQLDDIRAAAEAKYGSTDIDLGNGEVVRLVNPLRLPKTKRDKLMGFQDTLSEDDVDQEQVMAEIIRLVAENKGGADKLLKAVANDLPLMAEIMNTYMEGSQVGEASASQS